MEFRDIAIDPATGNAREGAVAGVNFLSDDGHWRVVATNADNVAEAEWLVMQHIDRTAPRTDAKQWLRRLPWVRLSRPEQAQVVAEALAALPLNASWEVARLAVRDALRTVGGAVFFRSMHVANVAAVAVASRLRQRMERAAAEADGRRFAGE